ncbi:hypothetical protein Metme_0052 [Methylomonas methanica MC09]|uniref:Uncharacterized protein n=1 Tax=Methylomonas methanica (strain DSM 25384 / MC09) TaxID=857087 RepID=F9ZX45_METMM|nr:hypothetical protein Metme_0052 [Methylomonas methanica MC09]
MEMMVVLVLFVLVVIFYLNIHLLMAWFVLSVKGVDFSNQCQHALSTGQAL